MTDYNKTDGTGNNHSSSSEGAHNSEKPSEGLQEEILRLQSDLKKTEEMLSEQKDKNLRAYAEIENIRRRNSEEISKARKFGIEFFAESLIPVKDSLEASLIQKDQSIRSIHEGVKAILRQLVSVFDRNQIKEISPKTGEKFDPYLHQAVSSIKTADQDINTIVQVLQKGYSIWDRILRPAMVVIAIDKE